MNENEYRLPAQVRIGQVTFNVLVVETDEFSANTRYSPNQEILINKAFPGYLQMYYLWKHIVAALFFFSGHSKGEVGIDGASSVVAKGIMEILKDNPELRLLNDTAKD